MRVFLTTGCWLGKIFLRQTSLNGKEHCTMDSLSARQENRRIVTFRLQLRYKKHIADFEAEKIFLASSILRCEKSKNGRICCLIFEDLQKKI